jgi:hypothetical protein
LHKVLKVRISASPPDMRRGSASPEALKSKGLSPRYELSPNEGQSPLTEFHSPARHSLAHPAAQPQPQARLFVQRRLDKFALLLLLKSETRYNRQQIIWFDWFREVRLKACQ